MSSVHNDLHSWAGKARSKGFDTIEISVDTADKAADEIVKLATNLDERTRILSAHCLLLLDIINDYGLKEELDEDYLESIEQIFRYIVRL